MKNQGHCEFCGRIYQRRGMTRHLKSCPERLARIQEENKGPGRRQKIYHLFIEALPTFSPLSPFMSHYWLHLEAPGRTTLDQLDDYLRAIWLECCGHLSAFEIDGIHYETPVELYGSDYGQKSMVGVRLDRVLGPGSTFRYEYDFGTTSRLAGRVVDVRQGKWPGPPIRLMARNLPPEIQCSRCDRPATWICEPCMWENQSPFYSFYCEEHLESADPHGGEMALPLLNSPRSGMCGYDGPAETPVYEEIE